MDLRGVDPKLVEAFITVVKSSKSDPPEKLATVGELWDEWAPWAEANSPSWRIYRTQANTFRRLKVKWREGDERTLFELAWRELTPAAGDRWRDIRRKMPNGRGSFVKDSTVNRELTVLLSMLNHHVSRKRIEFSPLAGVALADERRFARQTYLPPDQAKRFIEAGHPMFQDICTVAYRCVGMRHGEARCLKKSEIDWTLKVLNLSSGRNKNRVARVIPFPDDVEPILKRHCENSRGPYVFVHPRDPKRQQVVSGSAMQYWMEKARERSGIVGFDGEAVVIHSLRHAGVTRLVESGAPESFIKAAAGMCDATFRRYTKFKREQQQILREHMNRLGDPGEPAPTPVTKPLRDPRRSPRRAAERRFEDESPDVSRKR